MEINLNNINLLLNLLILINLIGIDYIYIRKINKFPIKKWKHLISIILPFLLLLYTNIYTIEFYIFLLILEILIILAFTDLKYLEIDGNSYWILIILSIVYFINNLYLGINIEYVILSPIFMYVIFWIFDKVIGIENLGGADVKIILILSFYYPATMIFSFMVYMFLVSLILFLFMAIKQRSIKNIQIPMIVSICISFFIQRAFFF